MSTTVEITGQGRSGSIEYREDGHVVRCGWEFGGTDVVAILSVPPAKGWDASFPWAAGRRAEILGIIAQETRRQRAPRTEIAWDEAHSAIYLKDRGSGSR